MSMFVIYPGNLISGRVRLSGIKLLMYSLKAYFSQPKSYFFFSISTRAVSLTIKPLPNAPLKRIETYRHCNY